MQGIVMRGAPVVQKSGRASVVIRACRSHPATAVCANNRNESGDESTGARLKGQIAVGPIDSNGESIGDENHPIGAHDFAPHALIHALRNAINSSGGLSCNWAAVNRGFVLTRTVRPRSFKTRKASSSVMSSPKYAIGTFGLKSDKRPRTDVPLFAARSRISTPSSNSDNTRPDFIESGSRIL